MGFVNSSMMEVRRQLGMMASLRTRAAKVCCLLLGGSEGANWHLEVPDHLKESCWSVWKVFKCPKKGIRGVWELGRPHVMCPHLEELLQPWVPGSCGGGHVTNLLISCQPLSCYSELKTIQMANQSQENSEQYCLASALLMSGL